MTAFFKEIEPFRGNGNENEKGQTLEEFLEEYDPYKYKNPCVTTDAVIFSCKRNQFTLPTRAEPSGCSVPSRVIFQCQVICNASWR